MVAEQIRAREIRDPRVLAAMERVPRHLFMPEGGAPPGLWRSPGIDRLRPDHLSAIYRRVLSEAVELSPSIGPRDRHRLGYQAAILGELAREVYTIEIVEPLAETARGVLAQLGYKNVHVRAGNGYAGWPEQAPFDRIIVTAAPDEVRPHSSSSSRSADSWRFRWEPSTRNCGS